MTTREPPTAPSPRGWTPNPMAGNPLRTRADLQRLAIDLSAPPLRYLSAGGARLPLGRQATRYPVAAAEMEGAARLLWGLVPLVAGGETTALLDPVLDGIAAGTDPDHPEFWGAAVDYDQKLVEMAGIGFALMLAGDRIWPRYAARDRVTIARWLRQINDRALADNNWQAFRVLVNLGLRQVGEGYDRDAVEESLGKLDAYYLGTGWYCDGRPTQRDYYVAFAIHFYGLLYAVHAQAFDPDRSDRFRRRARQFAETFACFFAADGAAIPFGRSMTYRFAQAAFWSALAYAGEEALPWPRIKGLLLRHLRWWRDKPIFDRDGVLSVGYGYPNMMLSEQYNAPGSPYWALKVLLPIALPEAHPFWQADEDEPADTDAEPTPVPEAGMLVQRRRGHRVALATGQSNPVHRAGPEKYAKFAYSSYFGFCVEPMFTVAEAAGDGMLLFSDDDRHLRGREAHVAWDVSDRWTYSHWQPFPDVDVHTLVCPAGDWHVRVHRVRTPRRLLSVEGGFALPVAEEEAPPDRWNRRTVGVSAPLAGTLGLSAIVDLSGGRSLTAVSPLPGANLIHPRCIVPRLTGDVVPGDQWLVTAVVGTPSRRRGEAAYDQVPDPQPFIEMAAAKLDLAG